MKSVMRPEGEYFERPTLLVEGPDGTVLRLRVRDAEVSVADDCNVSLTYTVPNLQARRMARLKKIALSAARIV